MRVHPRKRAAWLAVATAVGVGACDPFAFRTYSNNSPVVSLTMPRMYPDLVWGSTIAVAHHATLGDWLVSSGGLGTAVVATALYADSLFVPDRDPFFVCGGTVNCASPRVGVGLAGVATWGGARLCAMTGMFREAAMGMPATHSVHVRCVGESPPREFEINPPRGFEEAGFGLAIAAPRPRDDMQSEVGEVVFIGAAAGAGRLFMAEPSRVSDVTPPRLPNDARLGDALAVGRIPVQGSSAMDLLIAAGAPGARAAFVVRGDSRAGRTMLTAGCLPRADEPGFGGAVAIGDVDGDHSDDIVVGSRGDATGRVSRVHVFLTNSLPTSNACDASLWREAAYIDCSTVPGRGASCDNGREGFGSSLAVGDLDADGRDEIVIGAPNATVDGVTGAGAVWVVRTQGTAGSLTLTAADVLRDEVPTARGALGSSVLVERIHGRDEVLATAPGTNEVMLFYCSSLAGDRREPTTDGRCRRAGR